MRLSLCLLLLTLTMVGVHALELPLAPDAPFRTYSVADGLNQRAVLDAVQDQDGYLWLATFGGLNRFDGERFESITSRQGLRQNLIQALMVDEQNRLWAGDAGGGLTVVEAGRVVRTVAPADGRQAVVRAIVPFGDTLYYGADPGGVTRLDLTDPMALAEAVPGGPRSVRRIVAEGDGTALVLARDGLYRFTLEQKPVFETVLEGASGLARSAGGEIVVGTEDGRIGRLREGRIEWATERYPVPVTGFSFEGEELAWVLLREREWVDARDATRTLSLQGSDTPMLIDQEGVLWVPTRNGLARFLGNRFRHFGLELDGERPEVFAIQPGLAGEVWFGTNLGLLRVDATGTLENMSDRLGIDRDPVRGVVMAPDGSTVWIAQVGGPFYEINPAQLTATPMIHGDRVINPGVAIGHDGRLWVGDYAGALIEYNPEEGSLRRYELGAGAAIYGVDASQPGEVWFIANRRGLFRIDSTQVDSEPELVVPIDAFGRDYFAQLVVDPHAKQRTVWVAGAEGGVFRWSAGAFERFAIDDALGQYTVYAVHPLADGTVILGTSRGVYRYAPATGQLQHYRALDGFVSVEVKAHATYFDGDHTLWLGTASGVTAMDVTAPMAELSAPRPLIARRLIDGEVVIGDDALQARHGSILVDFKAISTRRPGAIEYSYRLFGHDEGWSPPSSNTSIGYSSLAPGEYRFAVRARVPGSDWSAPASWAFRVPTPLWRTPWFVALAILITLALTWSVVQLRLRAIEAANNRLRRLVDERTASIEAGRRELETANDLLSDQIQERQRADAQRADVEARFRQAYENSPIGMALVDNQGVVYDANPQMKRMFWPEAAAQDCEPLLAIVMEADRVGFSQFFDALVDARETSLRNMEVNCRSHAGEVRRIDFQLSPVHDADWVVQYVVALAQDVTESHAMTSQLAYQASYDELSGLLNRRAFTEQLMQANAQRWSSAYLLFLDLDQFKVVNDTCGHAAGDELLRMVAHLISGQVRDGDVVARLGGDEFALILRDCPQAAAVTRADRIREAIQELEFLWDAEVFRIGASIGLVRIDEAARSIGELQQLADAACYAAKDAGRNRVHLVSGAEDTVHERRGEMRWVQRLNQAIDTDSFVLYGQRIVSVDGRHPDRIEVLLRMVDQSTGRLIPPGAFLPAAERYGLQGRLDQWVVNQVIHLLSSHEIGDQQLWVNLSGASVGDAAFSRALIHRMGGAGLPSGCLNFEITETAVIRQIESASGLIEAMRDMGSSFALDDFGSGLSSFGYLKRLAVDCVKIDGQFVRDITSDPTDRIFVKSIIDIVHTQGMLAVAEFVEDDEVLSTVRELGSDFAQGFGVHRPEPLTELLGIERASAPASDSA